LIKKKIGFEFGTNEFFTVSFWSKKENEINLS